MNSRNGADIGTSAAVAAIEGTDRAVELVPRNIHPVGAVLEVRFSPSRVLMPQKIFFSSLRASESLSASASTSLKANSINRSYERINIHKVLISGAGGSSNRFPLVMVMVIILS